MNPPCILLVKVEIVWIKIDCYIVFILFGFCYRITITIYIFLFFPFLLLLLFFFSANKKVPKKTSQNDLKYSLNVTSLLHHKEEYLYNVCFDVTY